MALIKEYTTPQGVSASYHKIVGVQLSARDLTTTITVAVYASAEARDSDALPLWHEYVVVPFDDMEVDPRVPYYEMLALYPSSYLFGALSDVGANGPESVTPGEPAAE